MLSPAPVTFKTNRPPGSLPPLSGFSLLGVSGVDAAAFLQAQTMNDVRALADGHWHWNGWLNPKGRLIALFALLRLSADDFILLLPDFPAAELLPMLQRFVFRSKLQLREIVELVAAGASNSEAATHERLGDRVLGDRVSGMRLDFGGSAIARDLFLLPAADPLLGPVDAAVDAAWLAMDIAYGLPRLGTGQSQAWTPQMLSLERLHAFSLKKGCYPGQEIVARTHYLGQARRGLSRVEGIGLQVGASLSDDEGNTVGSVICTTPDSANGLAILQLEKRAQALCIGPQSVNLPAFHEGLQRPV
jgi:folate-binding protein YgfZ